VDETYVSDEVGDLPPETQVALQLKYIKKVELQGVSRGIIVKHCCPVKDRTKSVG
jgi:hypothetical protein